MSHEIVATESATVELALTNTQFEVLNELGRKLAASSSWWGGTANATASVIQIDRLAGDRYELRFRDVVGIVRLGDLQIRVRPKIPDEHFLYIIRHSDAAPRVVPMEAHVQAGADYGALLASWCVKEAEMLLRRGLRVDYAEFHEELQQVRGRIDVLRTATELHLGRPVAVCDFDELGEDTALNRVVRAACRQVAAREGLDKPLRRRAHNLVSRMDAVGPLQPTDRHARISRLTRDYGRCLPLAKLVLAGQGIRAHAGDLTGSVFLMRTPELVEDGIRNLFQQALPQLNIRKQGLLLGGSRLSINPDLVFGSPDAVGDVKYRELHRDWDRNVLYQGVAFATAYGVPRCGIFGFTRSAAAPTPPTLQFGQVEVASFSWVADAAIDPLSSHQTLATRVRQWAEAFAPSSVA